LRNPNSFTKTSRTFKRLPYLPEGVEISRFNCVERRYTYTYRYRYAEQKPIEIVVGAENKLYFRLIITES
jgi:hypothetical protein